MNKLWLIIQREYVTRVMKKSFLVITLIAPLIFVALFTVPALLAVYAGDEKVQVLVKDESGIFDLPEKEGEKVVFEISEEPLAQLKSGYEGKGYDGVLYLPSLPEDGTIEVEYFSEGPLSLGSKGYIERHVENIVERNNIRKSGYDEDVLNAFRPEVKLNQKETLLVLDLVKPPFKSSFLWPREDYYLIDSYQRITPLRFIPKEG